jgi:hypothetical protein
MHQGNFDVYVIVTQYNTAVQVTPRMLSDFNPVANDDEVLIPRNIELLGNFPILLIRKLLFVSGWTNLLLPN